MNIIGKKVYLRAMEPEDMELFREMTNNPEMERLVAGWSFPISKEQQNSWYSNSIQSKTDLRFSIVIKNTEELIGMLNLVDIDWKNGTATHGIRLSKKTPRKQGLGTDAVMTLMQYAFEELRLHRLEGGRIIDNIASKKLYEEKCGWKPEGIKREAVFRDGKFYDYVLLGIVVEDYYAVKERLGY